MPCAGCGQLDYESLASAAHAGVDEPLAGVDATLVSAAWEEMDAPPTIVKPTSHENDKPISDGHDEIKETLIFDDDDFGFREVRIFNFCILCNALYSLLTNSSYIYFLNFILTNSIYLCLTIANEAT